MGYLLNSSKNNVFADKVDSGDSQSFGGLDRYLGREIFFAVNTSRILTPRLRITALTPRTDHPFKAPSMPGR